MLELRALRYLVIPYGEDFRAPWPVTNWDTFDDQFAARRPDLRRLVEGRPDLGRALYYVLWWGDRPVPDGLDDRIRAGTLTYDDLADAVVTEFSRVTCPNCHAILRGLVADPGQPLTVRELTRDIPEEFLHRTCPVCAERIPRLIAELVES